MLLSVELLQFRVVFFELFDLSKYAFWLILAPLQHFVREEWKQYNLWLIVKRELGTVGHSDVHVLDRWLELDF